MDIEHKIKKFVEKPIIYLAQMIVDSARVREAH